MIAFFEVQDVKLCINSILANTQKADIIVLENPSPKSTAMHELLTKYKDKLLMYLKSNRNVAGQLFTAFINQYPQIIAQYDYIALTEGDVILQECAIAEGITLLEKYRNVGNCSVDLALHNYSRARACVPIPIDRGDHYEGPTGFQFIIFRRQFLLQFVSAINKRQLMSNIAIGEKRFTGMSDTNLKIFVKRKGKRWIRTKKTNLLHIGWEHNKNPNDEYSVYKREMLKNKVIRSHSSANISNIKFTRLI